MRVVLIAGLLTLGACSRTDDAAPAPPVAPTGELSSASAPPVAPAPQPLAIALDADGLRFVAAESGKTSLLAFGAERAKVEAAVARSTGAAPQRSSGDECPAGPTQFTRFGELQLAFQDDRWIGWALNDADPHTTLDGIGIGTTRREAEASRTVTLIPESTLGDEFVLGSPEQETAIGGLFGGPGDDARVQYLWAGTPCNFR